MKALRENYLLLTTLVFGYLGWVLVLGGTAALGGAIYGYAWFVLFYQLALIVTVTAILVTNTYLQYRTLILALLSISIPIVSVCLRDIFPVRNILYEYKVRFDVVGAGYIFIVIIQFIWIVLFGSEPDSFIGKYGPINSRNSVGVQPTQPPPSSPPLDQPIPPAEKILIHDPSVTVKPNVASEEYKERVQALHAYNANPEDPGELSFAKGEILEIVDRNGNWWQARKSNGSTGIIPSNYFGPSL